MIKKRALKKVFVSIKGIYYQAVIEGREVVWLDPWPYTQEAERDDVDYRVMFSFLQLYITMLGFINFRLYKKLGLNYPPKWDEEKKNQGEGLTALITTLFVDENNENQEKKKTKNKKFSQPSNTQLKSEKLLSSLNNKLKEIEEDKTENSNANESGNNNQDQDDDESLSDGDIEHDAETFNKIDIEDNLSKPTEEKLDEKEDIDLPISQKINRKILKIQKKRPLFTGLKFFLGREILKDCLVFVIMSCGGEVR